MYKFLILVCFAVGAHAQVPFWGPCPNVMTQADFDITRYTGRWYEMERYFAIFEAFASCVTAEYTLGGDDRVIVNNTGYFPILGYTTVIGDAVQTDPSSPGKLGVSFSDSPTAGRGDYWVIGTDYDNYSIVWSCNSGAFFNTQLAFILTRERSGLTSAQMDEVNALLLANNISAEPFQTTVQNECGYAR